MHVSKSRATSSAQEEVYEQYIDEDDVKARFEAAYGRNVVDTVAELAEENSSTEYCAGASGAITMRGGESARASQGLVGHRGAPLNLAELNHVLAPSPRPEASSRANDTDMFTSMVASEELNEFGAPVLINKA